MEMMLYGGLVAILVSLSAFIRRQQYVVVSNDHVAGGRCDARTRITRDEIIAADLI